MKRVLLSLTLAVLGIAGLVAQNTLTVTLGNGTQRVFQLSERPELLWEGDQLIISTATTELTIPRADFKGFSLSGASAIEAVRNGGSRITLGAGGTLKAEGLKAGSMLRVYDSAGRLCMQKTVARNGSVSLKLASKEAGTYFVKIDNQPTIKIMKP